MCGPRPVLLPGLCATLLVVRLPVPLPVSSEGRLSGAEVTHGTLGQVGGAAEIFTALSGGEDLAIASPPPVLAFFLHPPPLWWD